MKRTHPPGFYVLFLTEMWERWSFYLMKALVVIYMTTQLKMTEAEGIAWVGWYVGAVYLTPTIGGLLADRGLGPLRAALLGGFIMMLGHLVMVRESRSALMLAMGLVATGSGLFKPSMQALVRGLYRRDDARLDEAYSLFYVGINLGALGAPWAGNYLRNRWGSGAAFGSAAVGLGVGLVLLYCLRRLVVDQRSMITEVTGVPLQPDAAPAFQAPVRDGQRRFLAVVAVTLLVALYWAVANSDSGVLTLWVKDCVVGARDHAELYAAVNPACVFALTPAVAWVVMILGRRRGHPVSTVAKLFFGMLATLAACAVLILGARGSSSAVHWSWPVVYYAVVTVGELFVSPMSTALVAKIAPPRWASTMLGVGLLSSSIGGVLSGQVGRLWSTVSHSTFFVLLGLFPILGIGACLVAWNWLAKLLGEMKEGRLLKEQVVGRARRTTAKVSVRRYVLSDSVVRRELNQARK